MNPVFCAPVSVQPAWKLNILENGHDSYGCIVWNSWPSPVPRTKERVSRATACPHDLPEEVIMLWDPQQVKSNKFTLFEPIEWVTIQMVEQQGHPRVRALEGLVEEFTPPGRTVEFAPSRPTRCSDVMMLCAVPYQHEHPCAKKYHTTH